MKKIISFVLLIAMSLLSVGCDNNSGGSQVEDRRNLSAYEYSVMNLCGTDALGREIVPMFGKKTDYKRTVGIFYSVWLGQHKESQKDIYDVEKLLATEEGRARLFNLTGGGTPVGEFHFSSQPLYGYYDMRDPWIINKHVELLTACGIDYLCIDTTNAVIYRDVVRLLLDTLKNYREQGFETPKVMFYTNSNSGSTIKQIYNAFFRTDDYNDVWWAPNGKPMIVGIADNNNFASDQLFYGQGFKDYVSDEMKEFFDLAESQWPNCPLNDEYGFPWMSWQYPQRIHSGRSTMSVSVAQHSPQTIYYSDKHKFSSRGYDHRTGVLHEDWERGQNFQSQWETVFDNQNILQNVLITGWNEWMAIKNNANGRLGLVDAYNEEYSRDCEMSAGRYGDNFYMQLVNNVRKFKYAGKNGGFIYPKKTIDITDSKFLGQWDNVKASYKDFSGEVIERNFPNAVGNDFYVDTSNRNDITDVKIAHDDEFVYFYVKTKDNISAYDGGENWMNILISTGGAKSFEGYDYVINRSPDNSGKTSVEKSSGGYSWKKVNSADYRIYGNVLLVKVERASLGLTGNKCGFSFKVADNVSRPYDIMDYYVSGESVPLGRLNYSYGC